MVLTGSTNYRWSPILLAVHNPYTGTFEAVCKCMSGFTDKYYAKMKAFYDDDEDPEKNINTSKYKKAYYETALSPAIWFEPKEVWEIAFADITLSPTYSAAMGLISEDRGLSLRFPRFLRKREDKGIEEASTPQFLAGMPPTFNPVIWNFAYESGKQIYITSRDKKVKRAQTNRWRMQKGTSD